MALVSEINSLSMNIFLRKVTDNFRGENVLFDKLIGKAKKQNGGLAIKEPVLYQGNAANVTRWTSTDTLSTTDVDRHTQLSWSPTGYSIPMKIDAWTQMLNAGSGQIVDILKGKYENAPKDLADVMSQDMYSDGSTSKSMVGLGAVIAVTDPSPGALGGVAVADADWWKARVFDITTGGGQLTLDKIRTCLITVSGGRARWEPDLMIAGMDVYGVILKRFDEAKLVQYSDPDLAQIGYKRNVIVHGVPVVLDANAPANTLLILNTNYLDFYVWTSLDKFFDIHSGPNGFFQTEWQRPIDALYGVSYLLWAGAFTCNCRRAQGKIIGIDPDL